MNRALLAKLRSWSPSLAAAAFIFILFSTFESAELRGLAIHSGDTFMHVRVGQDIIANRAVPHVDTLSTTRAGAPYLAHEWGFQLLTALLFRWLRVDGLVLLSAFFGALCVWLMATRARLRGSSPLAIALALIGAYFFLEPRFTSRPHLASWVGFGVGLIVLDLELWRRRKAWLPFAFMLGFALWINLHLEALVFLGLMGLELLVLLLLRDRDWRWLAVIVAASAFGTLLNPYGFSTPLRVIEFLGERRFFSNIEEHRPLRLDSAEALLLLALMSFLVANAARDWRSARKGELARVLFMGFLAIASRRHISLFGVTVFAALAELVQLCIPRSLRKTGDWKAAHEAMWLGGSLAFLLLLLGARPVPISAEQFLKHHEHPVRAARFVREHLSTLVGPMYNNYDIGGFLTYAIPERPVYIDGRADFFGSALMDENQRIFAGEREALSILDRRKINWAIFSARAPLRNTLAAAGWRRLYSDEQAVVFARPTAR